MRDRCGVPIIVAMAISLVLTWQSTGASPLQTAVRQQNGTVSGRVLLPNGAPAPGTRVFAAALAQSPTSVPRQAQTPAQTLGNAMLVTSVAITDANGGYVLKDVPPGRYYVGAGPLETPTYAPGSSSPAGATLVVMTAGAALKVGDFRLRETPRKVSGLVIREKRHAAGTKVVLENPLLKLTAAIGRENNFTFPEVPPGIYEVGVSPDVGPLGISVVVGDKDLKLEVPIPLSAVTSVYVGIRVVVEDYPKIPWPKLQLKLVPTGAVALTAPAPRTIAVTGAIRIQLPVGQYFAESVLSEPLPDGYTIKWMLSEHDGRERPTEALTQPLVVTPTVKSIAIVIVKKGTDPE